MSSDVSEERFSSISKVEEVQQETSLNLVASSALG
jgi:hypothetical protein